jgi:cob(I)alamin adenosyltransferase
MVKLTRIYTRTGDDGTTALGDFTRVAKNDPRLVAYADVDETNAAVGLALAMGQLTDEVSQTLLVVQNDLFDVGADLCTPVVPEPEVTPLRVQQTYVDWLEEQCDHYNEGLATLRTFVLPGGTPGAALLHQARTQCRRAERSAWRALDSHGGTMNPMAATYLNRLSDLLFIVSRHVNQTQGDGDVPWVPGRRLQSD